MTDTAKAEDLYSVLGVSKDADTKDVQRAYRKLARKYHPDLNKDPDAEDRFKQINTAHEVLSNEEQRAKYDRLYPVLGDDWDKVPDDFDPNAAMWGRNAQGAGSPFGAGGPFGAGRPGPGGGQYVVWEDGVPYADSEFDIEDLLGGMFGGRRGPSGPMQGADQEAEIEITLLDAYNGTSRQITLGGPTTERTFTAKIPAGVTDGQRIRLAGKGGQGAGGGPPGDLLLRVHVRNDPRFRLDGRNISTTVDITPWEAALGATVGVATPTGETTVKVPAGSSSGRRLRLSGRGVPSPKGTAGDLFVELRIVVPDQLDDTERELLEKLSAESAFAPRSTR